jgi:hypothetical protein
MILALIILSVSVVISGIGMLHYSSELTKHLIGIILIYLGCGIGIFAALYAYILPLLYLKFLKQEELHLLSTIAIYTDSLKAGNVEKYQRLDAQTISSDFGVSLARANSMLSKLKRWRLIDTDEFGIAERVTYWPRKYFLKKKLL